MLGDRAAKMFHDDNPTSLRGGVEGVHLANLKKKIRQENIQKALENLHDESYRAYALHPSACCMLLENSRRLKFWNWCLYWLSLIGFSIGLLHWAFFMEEPEQIHDASFPVVAQWT